MRIGWLMDKPSYIGGAELTQREFRAAAPRDVEIVDCPVDGVVPDLDRYVIHNCVTYLFDELRTIEGPAFKYHNDVGPWLTDAVRSWLRKNTTEICCSPLQAEYMAIPDAVLIPPAIDLDWFARAAESTNGNRSGAVCIGSWRNYGKAPHRVVEWAQEKSIPVDFYGSGPFAPSGSTAVAREAMPGLLARYCTFVYLPAVIEPFGRSVVEAWAAGCSLVINSLVGAGWWVTEEPERLETAAQDFWELVCGEA